MAKGQIIEPNLITSNVKDGVEIFGVTGNYTQTALVSGIYHLGPPTVSWTLGNSGVVDPSGFVLFHDNGTKIVIMGESSLRVQSGGNPRYSATVYYCEIDKATGVLNRIAHLFQDLGPTTDYGSLKLVLFGGEYYWSRTTSAQSLGYYKFDGVDIIQNTSYRSTIISEPNVGSTFMSYNGKTLQTGGIHWEAFYNNVGGTSYAVTSAGNVITMLYQ